LSGWEFPPDISGGPGTACQGLTIRFFDQQIPAYITPEQYKKIIVEQKRQVKKRFKSTSSGKLEFAGKYGSSLFSEISRYAVGASEIARNESHNIIHAHDWLTYPA